MDQDPTLFGLLPPELLQELIVTSRDFNFILTLHTVNPNVRRLLDCVNSRLNPANDLFLADTILCDSSPTQTTLLNQINVNFDFKLSQPVTWPKLLEAYKRTAFYPACYEYVSISECLRSAAKYGLEAQLFPSTSSEPTLYDRWLTMFQQVDVLMNEGKEPYDVKDDMQVTYLHLARAAYMHNHLELGEKLLSASGLSVPELLKAQEDYQDSHRMLKLRSQLLYWRYHAWSKYFLQPYKVKRSRDIRALNYSTLFADAVELEDKVAIWASKYRTPDIGRIAGDILVRFNEDEFSHIYQVILAKLGIYDRNESDIFNALLLAFQAQAGNLDNVKTLYRYTRDSYFLTIGQRLAVKRGFYPLGDFLHIADAIPLFIPSLGDFIANNGASLANFSLKEIEALNLGISEYIGETPYLPEGLLAYVFSYAGYSKYQQARQELHVPAPEFILQVGPMYNLDHIDVLNDVMAQDHYVIEINVYDRDLLQEWFEEANKLFLLIWNQYGRQQFEDTLIYLQVTHSLQLPVSYDLIDKTILNGCRGLLAYMFGYTIDGITSEGLPRLVPLSLPGLISVDINVLKRYLDEPERYIQEEDPVDDIYEEVITNRGNPDMALLLLALEDTVPKPSSDDELSEEYSTYSTDYTSDEEWYPYQKLSLLYR